jgi:hypothetical protein
LEVYINQVLVKYQLLNIPNTDSSWSWVLQISDQSFQRNQNSTHREWVQSAALVAWCQSHTNYINHHHNPPAEENYHYTNCCTKRESLVNEKISCIYVYICMFIPPCDCGREILHDRQKPIQAWKFCLSWKFLSFSW